MTDEEFLKRFEDCTLEEFHHPDHIRVAWIYLRTFGYRRGSEKIKAGIRHFASSKNANTLYHETITEFWIRLVQHVITGDVPCETFEDLLSSFPPLAESKSIYSHYTKHMLMSDAARSEWLAPDILPMPWVGVGEENQ